MNKKNIYLIIVSLFLLTSCSEKNINPDVSSLEDKIDNLEQQNATLTENVVELQKVIQEIMKQQELQQNISSDIKNQVTTITTLLKNNENNYISEEQAMIIAKEMNGDTDVSDWEVKFQQDYVPDKNIQGVSPSATWIIQATHQFGNKTIFYIDALTREIVNIAEIENKH